MNTNQVGAQHIGVDLIAHQGRLAGRDAVPGQALQDARAKGLSRTGDAGKTIPLAKERYSLLPAVGHHAQRDSALLHGREPFQHPVSGHIRGIRDDGIVKIHHQKTDARFVAGWQV